MTGLDGGQRGQPGGFGAQDARAKSQSHEPADISGQYRVFIESEIALESAEAA